jgi:uncharacterized protein with gpF-like domain
LDDSYDEIEEKLRLMEEKLSDIYERAESELGQSWKAYLEKIDAEIAEIQKKYDEAKRAGNAEEARKYGRQLSAIKRERTLGDEYYRDMTDQIARQISAVNETAAAYINGELPEIYATGYNGIAAKLSEDVYSGVSFTMTDAQTVKRLATEVKTLLPYKYINGKKDVRWNTQKLNSEVLQGILQGETMTEIADRFARVLKMDETSAIRNARTAVTGAENAGRINMLKDAEKKGVLTKKVWSCVHDERTRDAHRDLDGDERDPDEPFESAFGDIMFPGDPNATPANVYNCRCRMRYKVVGFRRKENGDD